jgi:hypothetical protein
MVMVASVAIITRDDIGNKNKNKNTRKKTPKAPSDNILLSTLEYSSPFWGSTRHGVLHGKKKQKCQNHYAKICERVVFVA